MREIKVVLDCRTEKNQSLDTGDFVVCINCGTRSIVDIGEDTCPVCKKKTLEWEDMDNQEVDAVYFESHPEYMIIDQADRRKANERDKNN